MMRILVCLLSAAAVVSAKTLIIQAPPVAVAPSVAGSAAIGSGVKPAIVACPKCVCKGKKATPGMESQVFAKNGCPPCPCIGELYNHVDQPPTEAEEKVVTVPGMIADAKINNAKSQAAVAAAEAKLRVVNGSKSVPFGIRQNALAVAYKHIDDAVDATVQKTMAPVNCKYRNKDCHLVGAAKQAEAVASAAIAPPPGAGSVAGSAAGSVAVGSVVPMGSAAGSVPASFGVPVAGSVAAGSAAAPVALLQAGFW